MIDLVSVWSTSMAQLLLPIGLTVAVLWIVDTRFKSIPAVYRSWMWRLFFVKCLVVTLLPWYSGIPQLSTLSSQFNFVLPRDSATDLYHADFGNAATIQHAGQSSTTSFVISPKGFQTVETASISAWCERQWSRFDRAEVQLSLFLIWLLCASLQLAMLGRNYSRMITALHRGAVTSDSRLLQLYRSTAQRLGVRKHPPLRLSENAKGPALVYCGSVKILLPSSFRERFGEEACGMAFAHELAHFVRRDILWNVISTCVSVVFWFYPPVWVALRRYRITMESACDELAVRAAKLDRPSYARLLVSLLEPAASRTSPIMLTMARSESFYSLSERLNAMKNTCPSRGSRILSAATLSMLTVWLLAPWSTADEPTQETKSTTNPTQTKSFGSSSSGGASAGAGGSASGFASGGAGGGATAGANVSITSGNGGGNDKYRSGSSGYPNTGNGSSISVSSSSFSSGGSAGGNATANASGNMRGGVTNTTDGDTRVSKTVNIIDGDRVSTTRITTKQETITVQESDEDGVEVRVAKRGQRARDAKVYHADSMKDFATEQPTIYASIKKYVEQTSIANTAAPGDVDNPAKKMMVEQLQKMLDESRGNPQLESMIRKMIQENQ